eukprot:CAMPEP_0183702824 /NCGR_PEP_ID=MMETSP0737-20130205/804_1 /TAXON_ID=385413 /ORGANISM="Thalassiosira miniscula, Strain CCMP1093" /LENGTH=201 /DNA_ID=CAMNT_0025929501 /DNA_START=58 /DNA_END=663 /DNA_ORIENTATION=-
MNVSSMFLALFCGVLSIYTVLAGTNAEGLAYLEAKGKEEGVVTLPSGLMYKEIRPGNVDGKTPTADSPCECHYAGTLIDGTQFDSSYDRGEPTTFAPNEVIRGWTEAMQLMKEGAKWELYIPSELAYGDTGIKGAIPGGAVLVFTLELLKVKGDFVYLKRDDTEDPTLTESEVFSSGFGLRMSSPFLKALVMGRVMLWLLC